VPELLEAKSRGQRLVAVPVACESAEIESFIRGPGNSPCSITIRNPTDVPLASRTEVTPASSVARAFSIDL
jgi:hypothetical protein